MFYDTHAHLDYPDFENDLPAVIDRARQARIEKIICVGTNLESSVRSIELAEQFPDIFAVVGWHPSHAMDAPGDLRPELRRLAAHPKVVAIGETGLDYSRLPRQQDGSTAEAARCKQRQAEIFRQQLEVAAEAGLNCVIHQRDAFDDVLSILSPQAGKVRGVFHCFTNSPADMQRVLELGSLVSFTGIVTFKNARNIREAVAAAPPGHFMLETDCPFLAPAPYRGKRCEPAHVNEIAQAIADTRQCSLDELSAMTRAAAHAFFRALG